MAHDGVQLRHPELVPVPATDAARLRSEGAEALAKWLDWLVDG